MAARALGEAKAGENGKLVLRSVFGGLRKHQNRVKHGSFEYFLNHIVFLNLCWVMKLCPEILPSKALGK